MPPGPGELARRKKLTSVRAAGLRPRQCESAQRRPTPGCGLGERKGLAAVASANPSSFMVAGARFELWTRPLTFAFVLTY